MQRNTHKIDATNIALGRLASQIAILLRGKHKVTFVPYLDGGDIVEVSNVKSMKFTGNKLENKKYYRHSGYPGGLKTMKLGDRMKKNANLVLRDAVYHMLPDNKLRDKMITRLKFVK